MKSLWSTIPNFNWLKLHHFLSIKRTKVLLVINVEKQHGNWLQKQSANWVFYNGNGVRFVENLICIIMFRLQKKENLFREENVALGAIMWKLKVSIKVADLVKRLHLCLYCYCYVRYEKNLGIKQVTVLLKNLLISSLWMFESHANIFGKERKKSVIKQKWNIFFQM